MNSNMTRLALFVGITSLLLTVGQVLNPAPDDVLLRALVLGQVLNLIAMALVAATIHGRSSRKR